LFVSGDMRSVYLIHAESLCTRHTLQAYEAKQSKTTVRRTNKVAPKIRDVAA